MRHSQDVLLSLSVHVPAAYQSVANYPIELTRSPLSPFPPTSPGRPDKPCIGGD